jgi:predicted metal-binding transcription factor (methanogenesis marker protein 9)
MLFYSDSDVFCVLEHILIQKNAATCECTRQEDDGFPHCAPNYKSCPLHEAFFKKGIKMDDTICAIYFHFDEMGMKY